MTHGQAHLDDAAKGKHGSRSQLWLRCIHQLLQALWQALVQCCSCGLQLHVNSLGIAIARRSRQNICKKHMRRKACSGAAMNKTLAGQADLNHQHEAAACPKHKQMPAR